jgi:hypothetical protein
MSLAGETGYSCFNLLKSTQEKRTMKAFTAFVALTLGLAVSGMAAEFKGFVEDTACSTKAAMKDNAACAQKCIKGGSPAVLIAPDGKIYKIANQDKIVDHAGKNVTVNGSVQDDTITIESVAE